MPFEQKGYIIILAMTSEPDPEDAARAQMVALLTSARKLPRGSPYREKYDVSDADERAWSRATEQERRRMLKDCGWL